MSAPQDALIKALDDLIEEGELTEDGIKDVVQGHLDEKFAEDHVTVWPKLSEIMKDLAAEQRIWIKDPDVKIASESKNWVILSIYSEAGDVWIDIEEEK